MIDVGFDFVEQVRKPFIYTVDWISNFVRWLKIYTKKSVPAEI
jgi:hypothetical protein